jgi:hypothetical protein
METTQVRENEEVVGDEQTRAIRLAAAFAMAGLLVTLFAVFLTFAPGA